MRDPIADALLILCGLRFQLNLPNFWCVAEGDKVLHAVLMREIDMKAM